ncbi:MAG: TIR domain-containing protein [Nostocaceae cyanobacterium]|nr:TIR domain-containing protein [Nostocaceae cyanobacterium]
MNSFQNVFISYGRADSKDFAVKLYQNLSDRGLKVWFDFQDIPLGVDFQNQIDDGIEKADNFLFIIAPHSINSPYCRKEIELAVKCHKRIIPLLHVEQISRQTWQQRYPQGTDADWEAYQAKGLDSSYRNMHPEISKINWVYFREGIDDFDKSLSGLLEIFQRHNSYVHQHTHFLAKALEWDRQQQQSRYLLVGEEKQQAQEWLKVRFKNEQPPCTPTDLHCEYITESIKNAQNLMTQVFLAYAHSDKPVMEKIRNSLRRSGFTVWTNSTDIQTGEAFEKAIKRGIEQTDNVVYLLSPEAINSEYCQHEFNYAVSLNKRIIPVLVRETPLPQIPNQLRQLQYIDLTDNVKEEDYLLHESQLLKILHEDAAYYNEHKVLLTKALEWKRQQDNPSILLRGYNLRSAETWLKVALHRTQHPPIPLIEEFITASLRQPPLSSLDVFISYSRADSDLARKLNHSLQTQGKTTWFDQESIASGSDFQQEIYQGIKACDNFVFILSPRAVNSPYCQDEVEYAASLNKRFVTLLHQQVNPSELHPELAKVQWIDFNHNQRDFNANFNQLVRTLDTDREHVHSHSKWLQRAIEWQEKHKSADLLLRGSEFLIAQAWLQTASQQNKQPAPTALQQTFVAESHQAIIAAQEAEKQRQAEMLRLQEEKTKEAEARLAEQKKSQRRQKMFLGVLSVALVMTTLLTGGAFVLYRKAFEKKTQAQLASAEALAKSSTALFADNKKLDALIEALKAKQALQGIKVSDKNLTQAVEGALEQAVFRLRQKNRLTGHKGPVLAVAISPDGQTIASGSRDNTIKLWNRDGTLRTTLPRRHKGSINDIAISPDGKMIASASTDKTITLWQPDGKLLHTLTGHEASVEAIAFSPDGKLLASASDDKTVKLWDRDGNLLKILKGHKDEVDAVAFSPDGKLLASASDDKTVKLWNRDGNLLKTLKGHTGEVEAVAFSPDGKLILSGGRDKEHNLKLWNRDGSLKEQFSTFFGDVEAVAFSPDGKTIAYAGPDKDIYLLNQDGSFKDIISGHGDRVTDVAFSHDGKTILSASEDNTVNLWRRRNELLLTILHQHKDIVTAVAFSSVCEASPEGIGQTIASASNDHTVKLWRQDGTLLKTLTGHKDTVTAVAFSPVREASPEGIGQTIASASNDNTVKLWNLEGKLLNTLKGHKDDVTSLAFSPDGKLIATGSQDHTVKLWNLEGNLLANLTAHKAGVTDVSFSPDGQFLATASEDNTAKVWRREGIRLNYLHMVEHRESVKKVVFSSDTEMIASASADNTIKIWNSRLGIVQTTLYGHTDAINGLAFSPDGQTLASGSDDTEVILWPLDRVLHLNKIQAQGCQLLQDFQQSHADLRQLCDQISSSK